MTEYIGRECLVKEAEAVLKFIEQHYSDRARIADAKSTVECSRYYAPAANPVEVVRCKDCRWGRVVDDREPMFKCVIIAHDGRSQWWDSNDFCSYGERKDNG